MTHPAAVALLSLAAIACATAACGDPSGKPAFEFTPAPYTVVAGPNGTPIAIGSYNGEPVIANQVLALVQTDRLDHVKAEITDLGFQFYQAQDPPLFSATNLTIEVPPGSVPDAIVRIRSIDGAIEVGPSGFKRLLE